MFAALLLHISLAFPPATPLSPSIRASATAEAAAIWSPRGVLVDAGEPCSPIVLTVVVASSARVTPLGPPLGSLVFAADGTPQPTIVLYVPEILRLVGTVRFLGMEESRWPPDLRETIVGRAVGRVLAHEIGHYVLRSPNHTEHGLMRSFQRADDLVGTARTPFKGASIEDGAVTVGGEPAAVNRRRRSSTRPRTAPRVRRERLPEPT